MSMASRILRNSTARIALIALAVIALDQFSKQLVLRFLGYAQEKVVIEGFFKLVHWGNTGAAWSLFRGNNEVLAVVALLALIVLFFSRHHFDSVTWMGQSALGLIFGGIIGNLIDRLTVKHVIDFLYFYVEQRGRKIPVVGTFHVKLCPTRISIQHFSRFDGEAYHFENFHLHQQSVDAIVPLPSTPDVEFEIPASFCHFILPPQQPTTVP